MPHGRRRTDRVPPYSRWQPDRWRFPHALRPVPNPSCFSRTWQPATLPHGSCIGQPTPSRPGFTRRASDPPQTGRRCCTPEGHRRTDSALPKSCGGRRGAPGGHPSPCRPNCAPPAVWARSRIPAPSRPAANRSSLPRASRPYARPDYRRALRRRRRINKMLRTAPAESHMSA